MDHIQIMKLLLHSLPKQIHSSKKLISYSLNSLQILDKLKIIETVLYEKIGKIFVSNFHFHMKNPSTTLPNLSSSSSIFTQQQQQDSLQQSMNSLLDVGQIMNTIISSNENAQLFIKEFIQSSLHWEFLMKNISSSKFKIGVRYD